MPRLRPIAALVVLVAAAPGLGAQGWTPRLTIATNPIAPAFGVVSGELELALGGRGVTIGVGGTHDSDDENLSWVQGKLKFYPRGTPLRGFAIGATAGVIRTLGPTPTGCGGVPPTGCAQETESAPMAGVVLDYNLALGRRQRFFVGGGVGAQRVFRSLDANETSRIGETQFDGRLVVGLAF